MRGPRLDVDHPDRWLECQEDLEEAFAELVERSGTPVIDLWPIEEDLTEAALAIGWQRDEIGPAITELAINYRLRMAANAKTDRQIAEAMALIPKH